MKNARLFIGLSALIAAFSVLAARQSLADPNCKPQVDTAGPSAGCTPTTPKSTQVTGAVLMPPDGTTTVTPGN